MPATVDILRPDQPKRVLIVASNPAVSNVTGWPVGFWWSELTHPWWEFTEHGYQVEIASPDGGALRGDSWSDPRDESGYSAHDLISLGFIDSPTHAALVESTAPLSEIAVDAFDGVLFVGGQGPMFTFVDNDEVRRVLASFYEAGKVTAVICHATAVLLTARRPDGSLLVEGQDLDRLRQLRGAVRRRLRRPADPAVLDRGRGPQAGGHQLHRARTLPCPRGARRQPHHWPAAVLRCGCGPVDHRRAGNLVGRLVSGGGLRAAPLAGQPDLLTAVEAGGDLDPAVGDQPDLDGDDFVGTVRLRHPHRG
jgi:putative intracellular protease/amidase